LRHEEAEHEAFPLPGAEADHDGKNGGCNYAKRADHKVADAEERVLAAWVSEETREGQEIISRRWERMHGGLLGHEYAQIAPHSGCDVPCQETVDSTTRFFPLKLRTG
jgi:hypothetical protein